ncbi:MAG: M20/M25/M40 family metallo-hydrolase, partial [Gemmatimonadota bacterium]
MSDPVLDFIEAQKSDIIERLLELVSIPSVSTDPSYKESMVQTRGLLSQRLSDMGLENVQTLDAGGHPGLYGEWLAADAKPTLLVYGHYDVQPPDPLEQWHSPPFEPEIRGGRIYGRGVSDDKGPSSIALETIAAFLRIEHALPLNVKVLLEGEEETGSPTLRRILSSHRALLTADAVISADGARWRPDL